MEKGTVRARIVFKDQDGNTVKPSSATYVLFDKFTGNIRQEGNITPIQTAVYLELTSDANLIYNQDNRYEIAVLQVTYIYSGRTARMTTQYKIKNLAKVT